MARPEALNAVLGLLSRLEKDPNYTLFELRADIYGRGMKIRNKSPLSFPSG